LRKSTNWFPGNLPRAGLLVHPSPAHKGPNTLFANPNSPLGGDPPMQKLRKFTFFPTWLCNTKTNYTVTYFNLLRLVWFYYYWTWAHEIHLDRNSNSNRFLTSTTTYYSYIYTKEDQDIYLFIYLFIYLYFLFYFF
jgi:hypothetical protein